MALLPGNSASHTNILVYFHVVVKLCRKLVKEEGIHSVLLCPGFTHRNVAEIVEAVGGNIIVSVARGDGPSSRLSVEVRKRELSSQSGN